MNAQETKARVHLRNKWSHLKRQLAQRQLLFYKAEIPVDLINEYLSKTPSNNEILRIEQIIIKDRKEKTANVRSGLQKFVSHIKSPQLSRNIGISDTSVRDIWTGKKDVASYDIIDKLELYLNSNHDFALSVENQLSVRKFLDDEVDKIISRIHSVSDKLTYVPKEIKEVVKNGHYKYQLFGDFQKRYYSTTPIEQLNQLRENLDNISKDLESIFDSFIKKKD